MPHPIDEAQLRREVEVVAAVEPGLARRWAHHFAQPLTILRGYRRADLGPDLVAALTVAMVALPQAIAYAAIANLPPHFGIYSAIVASIVGGLWGSSRHLSTGPTNTASLLLLSILAPMVAVDSPDFLIACSIMAVLVGIFRVLFGLAGLGVLVSFVSRAVLLGFTAGAGVLIGAHQLRHLLRLPLPPAIDFFSTLRAAARMLPHAHLPSLAIGLAVMGCTLLINRFSRKLPGSLVALVAATALVAWLGADRLAVNVVGKLPGVVPHPTSLAAARTFLAGGTAGELLTGALALALLGLIEAVSIGRTIARSTGQRLDVNQEFVGQGMANIAAGLLNGYHCSGSFTRSAVNLQAGARTQLASVFMGVVLLGASLLLAPFLVDLPRCAVAGVIMLVAWGLIDRASIRRVLRTSRSESLVMGLTFGATLLFPLEFAVLSGVIFSLAMYLHHASTPHVFPVLPDPTFRHFIEAPPGAPACPQLAVMTIRGTLFFGATQHVEERLLRHLAEHPGQRYLLLRMHGVWQCDFTGIEMLETVLGAYRGRGGEVYMVQVRPRVREIMRQSGFDRELGDDHFLAQEDAVDELFETAIDPAICCHGCGERVFAECQAIPKRPAALDLPPYRPQPLEPQRLLNVEGAEAFLRARDPLVIDVRQPDEYRLGHLHGARLLPLQQLLSAAATLPRDRPLLLVCRAGRRSRRAMRVLLDLGFTDVQQLKGGVLSWKAADRPLEVE